ncbi:TPA: DUF6682 family protein [Salmonella enterica subsp. enterica serovar Muenchen]|nr:hypothetical protein [Salmonella enterica]HEC8369047.1 hypothetical protein [Salmonella enterica subsp. enterica serovar Muenchen]HEC8456676.1 hypothetical protein [Salmonella enterica subsp. enterica serovar Poona]HEC8684651.1 hypothetical protein [Salmonella enterica subsp. enterica serovar Oranienburg]EHK2735741.1 hypothetical protein [Salmonella enterica]
MMKIAEIIGRVNTQLMDTAWLRWPLSELCDYYNDAVRAVILARPDAGASVESLECVPGSRQSLPVGALRLIDVIRVTDGNALLPVPRDVLDHDYPDWHNVNGVPERYVYSEITPRIFYLFPAPDKSVSIDAVVCRIPDVVTISGLEDKTEIRIDEAYVNPLVDWMLFRAFSKDVAAGANTALAMQHYQAFADQLGIKQNSDRFMAQMKQAQFDGGAA